MDLVWKRRMAERSGESTPRLLGFTRIPHTNSKQGDLKKKHTQMDPFGSESPKWESSLQRPQRLANQRPSSIRSQCGACQAGFLRIFQLGGYEPKIFYEGCKNHQRTAWPRHCSPFVGSHSAGCCFPPAQPSVQLAPLVA